ncbi:MAG: hypothetical protein II825_06995 [Paludibacteraceae bacterium]|nr:hypothetical protein [Paludibacteraceae bacterium]
MKNLINRALAAEKRLFIVLAAALLLAGCESKTPEVGNPSSESYAIRIINSTSQADFYYTLTTSDGSKKSMAIKVDPGRTDDITLEDLSRFLMAHDLSDGIIIYPAALDLQTDTRVELDSENILDLGNNHVIVTLKYFLGHYSVSYEYESFYDPIE